MEIKGYFGKKVLDKIIRYINKYNRKKEIDFYKTAYHDEEDGFSTCLCLYPSRSFGEIVEDFSKSEMLYLQRHGFVSKNEDEEIVNVKTKD